MTEVTFRREEAGTAVAAELVDHPPRARCAEMIRTERGWETCRRNADGHQRHHVRGRSWQTGGPTPLLNLGHACDRECCPHPDRVQPYLGYKPNASDGTVIARRAARRAQAG